MRERPIHYSAGLCWQSSTGVESVPAGDAPCPMMRWRPRALSPADAARMTTDEALVTCRACKSCLARRVRP